MVGIATSLEQGIIARDLLKVILETVPNAN